MHCKKDPSSWKGKGSFSECGGWGQWSFNYHPKKSVPCALEQLSSIQKMYENVRFEGWRFVVEVRWSNSKASEVQGLSLVTSLSHRWWALLLLIDLLLPEPLLLELFSTDPWVLLQKLRTSPNWLLRHLWVRSPASSADAAVSADLCLSTTKADLGRRRTLPHLCLSLLWCWRWVGPAEGVRTELHISSRLEPLIMLYSVPAIRPSHTFRAQPHPKISAPWGRPDLRRPLHKAQGHHRPLSPSHSCSPWDECEEIVKAISSHSSLQTWWSNSWYLWGLGIGPEINGSAGDRILWFGGVAAFRLPRLLVRTSGTSAPGWSATSPQQTRVGGRIGGCHFQCKTPWRPLAPRTSLWIFRSQGCSCSSDPLPWKRNRVDEGIVGGVVSLLQFDDLFLGVSAALESA